MKFLDSLGLGYFWQKIKGYMDYFDGAITQLDKDIRYNAIYTFDATVQSAPPNLPRGYNWHVDMVGNMMYPHDYVRYFYTTEEDAKLDTTGSPNLAAAVARWVIDGKQMRFEYLTSGSPSTIVEITDTDGGILIPSFRPIPTGDVWFFGEVQAEEFPTSDNARSILDINVWGLSVMLGNTFNLETSSKQIVGAINEIRAQAGSVKVKEEPTAADALAYSQNNPDVFVFVARS